MIKMRKKEKTETKSLMTSLPYRANIYNGDDA